MSVLLSLTLAVPLVCLALLGLLGFVGIMALAGVMHVIVTTKAALRHRRKVACSMPESS